MKIEIDNIEDIPAATLGLYHTLKKSFVVENPKNAAEFTLSEVAKGHFRQYLGSLLEHSKRITEVE